MFQVYNIIEISMKASRLMFKTQQKYSLKMYVKYFIVRQ
jgi:hypothetical protein